MTQTHTILTYPTLVEPNLASTKPRGRTRGIHSNINIVPMIDVMLVLLVVFMLAVPSMMQQIPVQLPQTQAVISAAESSVEILSVHPDGRVEWAGKSYTLLQLVQQLQTGPPASVQLAADSATAYGIVAQTLATLKAAKVAKVSLLTEHSAK